MKKKSFKTLFFLEFIACFLSFLHIASVSIQQWNPCAVALLWQDNRHISIRHYLQKDRQIEWYRAQFNDCGTHVRLESSYDDNTTLYLMHYNKNILRITSFRANVNIVILICRDIIVKIAYILQMTIGPIKPLRCLKNFPLKLRQIF
jgi:hypothetical protein